MLDGVSSASVDFVSKKLFLKTNLGVDDSSLEKAIEDVVEKIEPDVRVVFRKQTEGEAKESADADEDFSKMDWLRLVVGGAFFALGVLFQFQNRPALALFLISYGFVGGPVVIKAMKAISRGQVFSEHFLMSVATMGAFFIGEYPEGVAVMLFYLVGELFQNRAVGRSRKQIAALMDIRPDLANLKVGDVTRTMSAKEIQIGDIIVVKPGERIPLDGKVIDGISMVDTAALTGEPLPRKLKPQSDAVSGFINLSGVLTVEVKKNFGESTVSKILELVENASARKAPTEKFITKFAGIYTPVVVFGALALAFIPPLIVPGATFSEWVYRAMVFLVVSCPCALVISIPLGFFGGIGAASKAGILIKGSSYLEALNHVETVVFDKTGTLTKGVFQVVKVIAAPGFSEEELVKLAAHAEGYSSHPIALSVMQLYENRIDFAKIEGYEEFAGNGLRANVFGQEVLVGNEQLMAREKIEASHLETEATVAHVAIDGRYAGSFIIADEVKEDAAGAIAKLNELGIKNIAMLTGDRRAAALSIAGQLGINEVYAELLPADKVGILEALAAKKSAKGKIAVVGDGINDAPILARADIGIAMGGLGSDAAIEAADVVIMNDEPSKIALAIRIAKRTRMIVMQNIFFALGIKAVFLVLGAFGEASMWEAVFADMGVALLAIFNSMRVMNTPTHKTGNH